MNQAQRKKANTRLLVKLALVVVGMFGFGYAMVPLYNVFCELTGLNGKTGRIAAQDVELQEIDERRMVTVEFVANLNQSMNLDFHPNQLKLKAHPGKLYTTSFFARNKSGQPMVGKAIPSVAPGVAAAHLKKTECFCFRRHPFPAGARRNMPVSFIIDADLPHEVHTVTLSYTFFDVTQTAALQ